MHAKTLAAAMGIPLARAQKWEGPFNAAIKFADLSTRARLADFIAQVGHESGGLEKLKENMNYKVEALLSLFGRHRISEADARKYGRTDTQSANQAMIANCVYGGPWGRDNLGNTEPGDGAKFIARGPIGITGRTNYAACSQALFGDDRLLRHPEQLEEPQTAAMSSAWFWKTKSLNNLADADRFVDETKRINGGINGLEDRKARRAQALKVL